MNTRIAGWITGALALVSVAAAARTLTVVPPGARVPIHFALDGRPNGRAPAAVGLLIIPAIAAVLWAARLILPRITPRGDNLDRSGVAYGTVWVAVATVLALAQADIVAAALGRPLQLAAALPATLGLMFLVIGNVMPKLRWNYVMGVRTPWTLADEWVWDRTHRFAGWLWVVGGLALIAAAVAAPRAPHPGFLAGIIGLLAVSPMVKSYLLWRERPGAVSH